MAFQMVQWPSISSRMILPDMVPDSYPVLRCVAFREERSEMNFSGWSHYYQVNFPPKTVTVKGVT